MSLFSFYIVCFVCFCFSVCVYFSFKKKSNSASETYIRRREISHPDPSLLDKFVVKSQYSWILLEPPPSGHLRNYTLRHYCIISIHVACNNNHYICEPPLIDCV